MNDNTPDWQPPRTPSAPAPGPASPPAGWYPDPADPAVRRYWNGTAWTGDQDWDNPVAAPLRGNGPGGRPYASFWERFFGLLLDSLILAVPTIAAIFALLAFMFAGEQPIEATSNAITGEVIAISLLLIVIQGAYFVIGIHKFGRTIGGKIMGIRCVDANGNNPSWRSSLIRWGIVEGFYFAGTIPIIGILAFPLSLINYLAMLWSPTKQCWMDAAARTYVVKST